MHPHGGPPPKIQLPGVKQVVAVASGKGGVGNIDPQTTAFPIERYGLKLMSMGFLVKPDQAVIWRGPMVDKYLRQFLMAVPWGELDTMVIDLPPGTGDAQL